MLKKIMVTALLSNVLYSGVTGAMENPVNAEKVDRIAEIIQTMGFEKGSQEAIEILPDVLAQSNIQASDEEITAAWNKIEAVNKPKIESGLPIEEEKRLIQNRMVMEEAMRQHFGEDMAKHGSKDARDVIAGKEVEVAKEFIFTCPTGEQVNEAAPNGEIMKRYTLIAADNPNVSFSLGALSYDPNTGSRGPLLFSGLTIPVMEYIPNKDYFGNIKCLYKNNTGRHLELKCNLKDPGFDVSKCHAVDENFRSKSGVNYYKLYESANPGDIKIICER